ncbi:CRISPR-associated endonuclease Cas1 [Kyrpidia spormannii]|nr:CRISPR-associated endonuclease Cas1 [Kyrpidia spormannii]
MRIYRAVGMVGLSVERGNLVVTERFGSKFNRRTVFEASRPDVDHIIVSCWGGSLSFDVFEWLNRHGVAFTVIDEHAEIQAEVIPAGHVSAHTKARQARMGEWERLALARPMIEAKIAGEWRVLQWLAQAGIIEECPAVPVEAEPDSLDALRLVEARAAAVYWGCVAGIPIRFDRPSRVPSRDWQTVGPRSSPKTGTPRRAVSPFHATLNYAYTILAGLARRVIVEYRIDPDIPLLHAYHATRPSLVYDVVEPVRPIIDRAVFSAFMKPGEPGLYARVESFIYKSDGTCVLNPDFARQWHDRVATKEVRGRFERIVEPLAEVLKSPAAPPAVPTTVRIKRPDGLEFLPVPIREYEQKDAKNESKPGTARICAASDCDREFIPNNPKQMYCSYRCRDREKQRRYRKEREKAGRCIQCGGPMDYPTTMHHNKTSPKYCSKCQEYFRTKYRRHRAGG